MPESSWIRDTYYVLGAVAIVSSGLAALWRTQIGTLRKRVAELEMNAVTKQELKEAVTGLIQRSDERWQEHLRASDQRWEEHLRWGRDMSEAIKGSVDMLAGMVQELKEETRYLRRRRGE